MIISFLSSHCHCVPFITRAVSPWVSCLPNYGIDTNVTWGSLSPLGFCDVHHHPFICPSNALVSIVYSIGLSVAVCVSPARLWLPPTLYVTTFIWHHFELACVASESTCISVGVLSSFHPFLCPPVFIFERLMASFLLDINLNTKKNKKATVFSCQFCSRTDRLIWPKDQSHLGINGNSCQSCAYLVTILTMTSSVNFKFYFYLISSYKILERLSL